MVPNTKQLTRVPAPPVPPPLPAAYGPEIKRPSTPHLAEAASGKAPPGACSAAETAAALASETCEAPSAARRGGGGGGPERRLGARSKGAEASRL